MGRRGQLPLDDANWVPVLDAAHLAHQRLGDVNLAEAQTNEMVKSGRVRLKWVERQGGSGGRLVHRLISADEITAGEAARLVDDNHQLKITDFVFTVNSAAPGRLMVWKPDLQKYFSA